MNILMLKFPYSSLFGGGERHTIALVEGLQKRGHQAYLVTSCVVLFDEFQKRKWPCQKIFMPREPVSKGTILLFPLTAPFAWLRLVIILVQYVFRHDIRAIICLSLLEKLLMTPVARLLRLKVFWIEHVEPDRWLTMNPYRFLYKLDASKVRIVVISNIIKQKLARLGIPHERISVIYPGIPIHGIQEKEDWRPFRKRSFVFGTVCRLEKEKGIEGLIKAFAAVVRHCPDSLLMIVGDGSQRKNLHWLANTLQVGDRVRFVGFQPDPQKWMRSFDCFILPSHRRESFGIVLLEALLLRLPVIASNLGGIPEIIENGRTGVLVQPGDHTLLFEAMLWVMNHYSEAMAMGAAGQTKVKEKFSLDVMVTEFERLLTAKE